MSILHRIAGMLALAGEEPAKPATPPPAVKLHRGRGFNHVSGKRFSAPDGTEYRVSPTGAWIRTSLRRCEARDYKDLHNNGVRRRNTF